jgi:hypothetical protein
MWGLPGQGPWPLHRKITSRDLGHHLSLTFRLKTDHATSIDQ